VTVVLATNFANAAAAESSSRVKRDVARARSAQLAAQLDTLRASDRQMDAAVAALDAQVSAQAGEMRAAESAVTAAEIAVAAAEARLAATEARLRGLKDDMSERAVNAYMRPGEGVVAEVLRSRTLGEASRRRALLEHVAGNDRDLADQLRAAREDEAQRRDEVKRARALAAERRRSASDRLRALKETRAHQVRVRGALESRIAEFIAEADQVAAVEAMLSETIRREEAAAAARTALLRASRPPAPAPRPAPTPPAAARRNPTPPPSSPPSSRSGLIWPVNGPVTSGFGMRWGRMHQGIDISASSGTPIRAAKAGAVITAGTMGGYGNVVIISHGGGFTTLYAHQSRLSSAQGQEVAQGQIIGYVGSTGHSTGPHLHFETRVNGAAQDPRRYL
jgi:murein DD-endopeptidase MepM/ murein hydrolase activator NlpD